MLIDLTHTIAPDIPVYPGTPAPAFTSLRTITKDGFRESALHITTHTGTHMDAPSHISRNGSTLDQLPVSQFCGRAVVLDVSREAVVTAEFLRAHHDSLYCADFLLLYTGWEKRWGTEAYLEDAFPVPDEEAAQYLLSWPEGCGHRRPQHRPHRGAPDRPPAVPGRRHGGHREPVPEKGDGSEGVPLLRPAAEGGRVRRRAGAGRGGAAGK